eukprot:m.83058 g.83058  ORF g.83058 m.83058 type:complete len:594 (+) comp14645_c0_seq2:3-1784(+)
MVAVMHTVAVLILQLIAITLCTKPPNVLFIVVDDLNPSLNSYNFPSITPNLDRLASISTQFRHAYVSVSVCAPSRTAFLTGIRPDKTHAWTIGPYFRNSSANKQGMQIKSLPQLFRLNGYNTTGAGKIWHCGTPSGGMTSDEGGGDQCPEFPDGHCRWTEPSEVASWTEPYWFCDQFTNDTVQSPAMQQWPCSSATWPSCGSGCVQDQACIDCFKRAGTWNESNLAYFAADCPSECYPEGLIANRAIDVLDWHVNNPSKPFFFGLGFKRPHLSYKTPKSFADMYPLEDIDLPAHLGYPDNLPGLSYTHNCMAGSKDVKPYGVDLNCTSDRCTEYISNMTTQRALRRAYYASVTFMDSQLGRVLDKLNETGLLDTTVISFIGDHGYSSGSKGLWCKESQFENGVRIPMMIHAPNPQGAAIYQYDYVSDTLAESVDLYPTLVELAGLQLPPKQNFGGRSLVPALEGHPMTDTHNYAISQWPRRPSCTTAHGCVDGHGDPFAFDPDQAVMSYSLRTPEYRYSVWFNYTWETYTPDFDHILGRELYDHHGDLGDYYAIEHLELENLAGEPSMQAIVTELHEQLVAIIKEGLGNPLQD